MAYGDVGLISGTDASNVVVSGTSWTADFQVGSLYNTGNQNPPPTLMESQADAKIIGGGEALFYRLPALNIPNGWMCSGWAIDTPYTIKITEGGAADVHVYINGVDIFSPDYFPSTIGGSNMLKITLNAFDSDFGGGWSLDNLSVNGMLFNGSWSDLIENENPTNNWGVVAQPITLYVDLSGSSLQSLQFTAELHHNYFDSTPGGQATNIQISSVAAVPEPSSFILIVISGVALLVLKKKPLRSN